MKKILILALCGLCIAQGRKISRDYAENSRLQMVLWTDICLHHLGGPGTVMYGLCDDDRDCKDALRRLGTKFYAHQGDGMRPNMITEN